MKLHALVEMGDAVWTKARKVDIRLPGQGISDSHSARPEHHIIAAMKWIRPNRLLRKNSLCVDQRCAAEWQEGARG